MFRCSRCGASMIANAPLCASCHFSATPSDNEPTVSLAGEALAASSRKETWQLTPGTILAGRYRIVSLVGEGGIGKVYRADDLKLGQTVALKFISPSRANDARWHCRRPANPPAVTTEIASPS